MEVLRILYCSCQCCHEYTMERQRNPIILIALVRKRSIVVPSKDECRTILGGSDNAAESVWREYLNKGVFSNEYYWSTTDAGNGNAYIMLRYMAVLWR